MFEFTTTTTKEPVNISFFRLLELFRSGGRREDITTSYYWRHREGGEGLEDLLEELFRNRLKARPTREADLNQIVNALVLALEGSPYEAVLEADPVELLSASDAERALLPDLIEGWTWCENRRIDRSMRAILKLGERSFSAVMAERLSRLSLFL